MLKGLRLYYHLSVGKSVHFILYTSDLKPQYQSTNGISQVVIYRIAFLFAVFFMRLLFDIF